MSRLFCRAWSAPNSGDTAIRLCVFTRSPKREWTLYTRSPKSRSFRRHEVRPQMTSKAPPSTARPKGVPRGGNGKYIAVAVVLLLGIVGLLIWKFKGAAEPIATIPSVPSIPPPPPTNPRIEDVPPPPPSDDG